MSGEIQNVGNGVNIAHLRATGNGKYVDKNGKEVDVSSLLANMKAQKTNGNKPNVISTEPYTYDGIEGKLVKYDNGTYAFQSFEKANGKIISTSLEFKNAKDVENKRPSSKVILNSASPKSKTTIEYEYYRNGNVKSQKTYNHENKLIRDEAFQKDGKISNRKLYDKNGELQKEVQFKWKNKTQNEVKVYDKDNKLIEYGTNTYWDETGKTPKHQETFYPSGKQKTRSEFGDNGKLSSKTEWHESGKVKTETECWDNGVIKNQNQYDENGNITGKISAAIDGKFGPSKQVGEGDCYLMASINSILELDDGQQMLNDLVQVSENENGEKIYTVTFPGAKIAAEGLKTDDRIDPDKMYITGTYTFTEAEMEEILKQAGKKYSIGNGNVILLEAAFEKYRQEVAQTMEANGISQNSKNEAGLFTGTDKNNILAGGLPQDATFVLTGRQSKVYDNYKNVKNGLDYEALQQGELVVAPRNSSGTMVKAAVPVVDGEVTNSRSDLDDMLDQIMNDSKDGKTDMIATAAFRVVHDDGKESGHALTIKSVTEDTVTLTNPWDPEKEITMTREEFKQCVGTMSITDTSKPPMKPQDIQQPEATQNSDGSNTNPPKINPQKINPNGNANGTSQTGGSEQNGNTQVDPQQNSSVKVRRGDNFWKIAKRDLEAKLGRKPTNREIANRMEEIIEKNGYKILPNGQTKPILMPNVEIML